MPDIYHMHILVTPFHGVWYLQTCMYIICTICVLTFEIHTLSSILSHCDTWGWQVDTQPMESSPVTVASSPMPAPTGEKPNEKVRVKMVVFMYMIILNCLLGLVCFCGFPCLKHVLSATPRGGHYHAWNAE